jgi:carbamoyl-phosphate synthase large subunit
MTNFNVLITGAGGPAGVVCIKSLLGRANVFAADMSHLSPGLFLVPASNRALVPAGRAVDFSARIVELCAQWKIDVLIPTVDAELIPCAILKEQLAMAGTKVLVSDQLGLTKCLDKWLLASALADVVPLPRTELASQADPSTWNLPFIAKPRVGSGGRGVVLIEKAADMLPLLSRDDTLLQELLPGAEYSVDVLVDATHAISAVVRERMRTDSGIAIVARVVRDIAIEQHAKRAAAHLGLTGIVNIQFKRDVHGDPKLLEINPRPPGTLALSIAAGADMVMWAVLMLQQQPLGDVPEPKPLAMVRTWQEQYLDASEIDALLTPAIRIDDEAAS